VRYQTALRPVQFPILEFYQRYRTYRHEKLQPRDYFFQIPHQRFDLTGINGRFGYFFRMLSHFLSGSTNGVALLV